MLFVVNPLDLIHKKQVPTYIELESMYYLLESDTLEVESLRGKELISRFRKGVHIDNVTVNGITNLYPMANFMDRLAVGTATVSLECADGDVIVQNTDELIINGVSFRMSYELMFERLAIKKGGFTVCSYKIPEGRTHNIGIAYVYKVKDYYIVRYPVGYYSDIRLSTAIWTTLIVNKVAKLVGVVPDRWFELDRELPEPSDKQFYVKYTSLLEGKY